MKTQITMAVLLAFGAGVTMAQPKEAPKKEEPKKDAPKKDAPKAAEAPKPPKEIEDMGKQLAGTWKCTGKASMDPAKPTETADFKATMTHKLAGDLDKWWIQSNFEMPMGKAKMKFVAYTTFNSIDKKWYRYGVDNMGGAEWSSSAGPKDNKIVWEGESMSQMPGMGKVKVRHTDDMSDAKAGVKVKGEMSMDGKTWITGYDGVCKK